MADNMARFTQRARRVLSIAQEQAERMRQNVIGTEHLLLGLMLEDGGVASRVLHDVGIEIDRLQETVQKLGGTGKAAAKGKLELAPSTKEILKCAIEEARRMDHHYIGTEHLILGLVRLDDSVAMEVLKQLGSSAEQIRRSTRRILQETPTPTKELQPAAQPATKRKSKDKTKTPLSDQLATDLTALAEQGKLDPVIGRVTEVERVIQILARRTKNNPALIGEPGVGKTAIVEGLAQRIVNSDVPELLLGKRVLQLDVGSLVAGTMYRGQFEERLKRVIDEVKQSGAILFIDEVHMLVGAGAAGSSVDAANILKPALARGEMQVIGATTLDEYRKHIESDAALERRFQPITVDEPSPEETIAILHGIRERYEQHHKLSITDEAINAAVEMAVRYVPDRFLPDKAIDLIDESSSRVRMYKSPREKQLRQMLSELRQARSDLERATQEARSADGQELRQREEMLEQRLEKLRGGWDQAAAPKVVAQDIAEVVSMWTGVPATQITEAESERLLKMEDAIRERIVGQDVAISAISRAVRRARAGLNDPRRPIGAFMFLGPTGVGKTELTKALASFMFGSEAALIQLDMSEFMERHSVSRLVGAPPGYVGYDDAGQLTEGVRRKPYSIVVFDEIEKAHPEAHNMLLQIMEEGQLSDARGRKVSFRNAIIVMTSNIGAELIKRQNLGFQGKLDEAREAQESYDTMKKKLTESLRRVFRPEFINRLDDTVVFRSLGQADISKIVDLELAKVAGRIKSKGFDLKISDAARKFISTEGYDAEFGARPLRRVIHQHVEDAMTDALLSSKAGTGRALVDYDESTKKITVKIRKGRAPSAGKAAKAKAEVAALPAA